MEGGAPAGKGGTGAGDHPPQREVGDDGTSEDGGCHRNTGQGQANGSSSWGLSGGGQIGTENKMRSVSRGAR